MPLPWGGGGGYGPLAFVFRSVDMNQRGVTGVVQVFCNLRKNGHRRGFGQISLCEIKTVVLRVDIYNHFARVFSSTFSMTHVVRGELDEYEL